MEPLPPMPPFLLIGIFFREMAGCWLSLRFRNDEAHKVSHLTPKLTLFWTPQKTTPSDPGIAFHAFLSILSCCLKHFGDCFSQKHRNLKSAFGLRRRARIAHPTFQKTVLCWDFAFHFLLFFPGPVFNALIRCRGYRSLKNGSSKGDTFAPCRPLYSKAGPTWGYRFSK